MLKTSEKPMPAIARLVVFLKRQKELLAYLGYAVCGFLLANAILLGQLAPFGVAFTAAGKKERTTAAGAGALLGYIFSLHPENNTRYIAAVALAVAVKWVLPPRLLQKHRIWMAPAIAFAAVFLPGLALASLRGYLVYDVVICLSESVLAAGSCFFFQRAALALLLREKLATLNSKDVSCLIISYALLVMALGSFLVGDVSVGRIAAVVTILLAAKCGRESGGAIAGVTAGVTMGILGGDFSFLAASYGFGGMLTGMFAELGSVVQALVFVVVNGLTALIMGSEYQAYSILYEIFLGAVLFLLIPASAVQSLVFWGRQRSDAFSKTAREVVLSKLKFASAALTDIGEATRQVSQKVGEAKGGSVADVFAAAAERVCKVCPQKPVCWGEQYHSVMDGFNNLTGILRQKGKVAAADFPGYMGERCDHKWELANEICAGYERFSSKREARAQAQSLRGVVTDQFTGMSGMLDALAQELTGIEQAEFPVGDKISALLERENLSPISVSAYTDQTGRMTVEAVIPAFKLARMDQTAMTLWLSELCQRRLQLPAVSEVENAVHLRWIERTAYAVQTAKLQHPCDGQTLCGDALEEIWDGRGQVHLLLSDGMGSGSRAALDSSMTVCLLKKLVTAGFSFDAALELANAALLVKSEEESLSTVDVATVDLYSGETQFLKAGAAPTFVYRDGSVVKVEGASMPAGILKGVDFAKSRLKLHAGDWIIMVSDGILLDGSDWIFDQIKLSARKSAEELAQDIWQTAQRRRTGGHDDDASVLVCKIVDKQ
ncbi:MAG: SpoIIE family protein phosphatase [Oscillospiraceae bacterium]|nr:SpoIIE family protein phosphatase [Oscillospiraceae bacterium]